MIRADGQLAGSDERGWRTNRHGQPVGVPVPQWAGALAPTGATLTGRLVTLRPLEVGDGADLAAAYERQSDAHWTYLPVDRPVGARATRAVLESALAGPNVPYAVLLDEVAAGMLSLMRIDERNGVIEIGWVAFGPALQRTAASTEAQRLLMGHVFDDLGHRRLEWKCDALNEPSMRAAHRLGYTFEGVFRQHVVVKGRSRDTAWWAMTDGEWPAVRARLDAWLDPSNFDEAGRQRTALGT